MIEVSDQPAYPTTLRSRLIDGRLQGIDGSLWMYRLVPMAPVGDARTPAESLVAAEPLLAFFEELAAQAKPSSRRAMSRGTYRDVHLLLVNVPQRFEPVGSGPLAEYLASAFPDTAIDRRVLLAGVRLRDKIGTAGLRSAIDSVIDTIMVGGTSLSDFDEDTEKMAAAMDRSGLVEIGSDVVRLANAWWNHGYYADTPMLMHPDHVHIFDSTESVNLASSAGLDECHAWTPEAVPGTHAVTFASVMDLDLDFVAPDSPSAHWVSELVDAGALAISIRGRVEPGSVTRQELRRQRKRFIDDINERAKQGKMERAEQEEMLGLLEGVEGLYATGGAPPATLAGASIVVGIDGQYRDVSTIIDSHSPVKLAPLEYRQNGAIAETWLCSPRRANPHLHDLPIQVIAASGLPSLSFVGDRDGALVGFSESDRQPSYLSPTAASSGDSAPVMLIAGQTGSGKTQFMQWAASQYARMGRPVIILDPKALALDTPVPTPRGWSTIGELAVGDQVLGRDGKPCNVTAKSRVFPAGETRMYEFVLDDGQVIRADANHQWVVYDPDGRRRYLAADEADVASWKERHLRCASLVDDEAARSSDSEVISAHDATALLRELGVDSWMRDASKVAGCLREEGVHPARQEREKCLWPKNVALKAIADVMRRDADSPYGRTLTTDQILSAGLTERGQSRFSVPVPSALELPERELPVDPYALGAWLGAVEEQDTVSDRTPSHLLRNLDVFDNKQIPEVYLRASRSQRLALLRGLMDADGAVDSRGELRIAFTNERLARGVNELVRSLGWKSSLREGDASNAEGTVTFHADEIVFDQAGKAEEQRERCHSTPSMESRFLHITDVREIATEDAQCIRVDSPDHTYLVGDFVVTHNTGSDLSPIVHSVGGQVASLDSLLAADGIFDPLRFSATAEVGVELATSMLMQINPWGPRKDEMEVPLQYALAHGVGRGATCIGQALSIAETELAGRLDPFLYEGVRQMSQASPMFRACVGVDPQGQGLRVAEGLTLIKVGNAHLDLPEPGTPPTSINQRITLALVRMMVFGSAMALAGRDGVLCADEAWVVIGAGKSEVERLGRLARSQRVLPMLFTQRATDAIDAGLAGYISRGLILPMEDPSEAKAAFELFRLEATPERMSRITGKATLGGSSTVSTAPNWNSMRALRDPDTGKVLRGAVGIYVDLSGRAVPVEISLPTAFLRDSTTSAFDARAREEAARRAAVEGQIEDGTGLVNDIL